ncbi:protein Dok-7 [Galendromus occidentalis]|uniref:Protein Dok-7 n=1 Tax=Galendromus occidentalis TaxID=34638 RepID=A0AAJ7L6P1_9ACAR|nr:protein Dok-7 [Galendromus occidentalis]
MSELKITIEGSVRVRENKRWKSRYCSVTKASPVANSLQIHLSKEQKNGQTNVDRRSTAKGTTICLENFLGVQSGFLLDKEPHTLAIFCQDTCVVLAMENRETAALWEARLRLSMPEVCHFDAQLVKVPAGGKGALGPCRIHIQDHQFCITHQTAHGPQVLHSWKIQELRRYGKLEENLYGFEGGSRSGKGEGAHVLMLDDVAGLEATFHVASQGFLNRQKKSVYNALMADLVGLRERFTSANSTSSSTLAGSVSSLYGGSTLRRKHNCQCQCADAVSLKPPSEYDPSGSTTPAPQPAALPQDVADTAAETSAASSAKLCDRSSLCSESSGTGSCGGSVGLRSDESSDYDVPKNMSSSLVEPSSCYDQPKNLQAVVNALRCPCQPQTVEPLLDYDVPAQICSNYDTPKTFSESLRPQAFRGPMLEYDTIKAITSAGVGGTMDAKSRLLHSQKENSDVNAELEMTTRKQLIEEICQGRPHLAHHQALTFGSAFLPNSRLLAEAPLPDSSHPSLDFISSQFVDSLSLYPLEDPPQGGLPGPAPSFV